MKTSKIIYISLLGTIAVLILASVVDLRMNSRRNDGSQSDFKVNKQILPLFKALRVHNSMNITLVQNDSAYFEVSYLKDSITPKVNYTISGDTLTISDFEKTNHRNVSVTIHATDSLRSIQLKKSNMRIERIGSGKLFFALDESEIWLNQDTLVKTAFQVLDIVAKNHSRINSSEFMIDSLGLVLQNSEAYLEIKANKISGILSDSSRIFVRQPSEISLKKDETSKIHVNDY